MKRISEPTAPMLAFDAVGTVVGIPHNFRRSWRSWWLRKPEKDKKSFNRRHHGFSCFNGWVNVKQTGRNPDDLVIIIIIVVIVIGGTRICVGTKGGHFFVVVFTSIGLLLVPMASDVSSSVVGNESMSNSPGGMGTTSSSLGSLLVCFGCFLVNFLTRKLRTV